MKAAIVIPTIRDLTEFTAAWSSELRDHIMVVVEDRPEKTIEVDEQHLHFSHKEIREILGDKSWIIPNRSSAIRSFGIWYAATRMNVDFILNLDDDVRPDSPNTINRHWKNLCDKVTLDWVPSSHEPTRGFPYNIRSAHQVMISHGLWSNIPDYDAPNQLLRSDVRYDVAKGTKVIPRWNYYPMCGMNVAFRPEIAPAMYFGLQGGDYIYDRFDDIWAGVVSKRVCDEHGWGVVSGEPSVNHIKASDVMVNLRKEGSGFEANEKLWKVVDEVDISKHKNVTEQVRLISEGISSYFKKEYFEKLKEAYNIWTRLFEK